MKIKTILLLFFAVTTYNMTAQIQKGTILIDHTPMMRYEHSNSKTFPELADNQSIAPHLRVGYAFSSKFMLGAGLGYRYQRMGQFGFQNINGQIVSIPIESNINTFNLATFARFYLPHQLFIEPRITYTTQRTVQSNNEPINEAEDFQADLNIGHDFFLTKNVAWENVLTWNLIDDRSGIILDDNSSVFLNSGQVNFLSTLRLTSTLRFFLKTTDQQDAPTALADHFLRQGNIFVQSNLNQFAWNFKENNQRVNFQPSVSYFIKDKFYINAAPVLSFERVDRENIFLTTQQTGINLSTGYFFAVANNFYIEPQVGLGWSFNHLAFSNSINFTGVVDESRNRSLFSTYNTALKAHYFFNRLHIHAGYTWSRAEADTEFTPNALSNPNFVQEEKSVLTSHVIPLGVDLFLSDNLFLSMGWNIQWNKSTGRVASIGSTPIGQDVETTVNQLEFGINVLIPAK